MTVIERVDRKQRAVEEVLARECRATRHWMMRQPSPPAGWDPPPRWRAAKHVIHYECQRCGTWRHLAVGHLGGLLASDYVWPDWYRRPGEERITNEELRLWQVKQAARDRRAGRVG